MSEAPRRLTDGRLAGVVLAATAVLAFAPSLAGEFVLDDHSAIEASPCVTEALDLARIAGRNLWCQDPAGATSVDAWRPLTTLGWWFAWSIGDGAAWVFHALNVAVHAGVTVLTARLARALGASSRAANLAGIAFAVLAIHADAVASAVGLAELLAAGFGLAALRCRVERRDALALGLLVLAMLAKESAVAFALAIALWPVGRERCATDGPRWTRRDLAVGLAALLVVGAMLAARASVLQTWTAQHVTTWVNPLVDAPWSDRPAAALALIGRYHVLALSAWPLSADYSFSAIEVGATLDLRWLGAGVLAVGAWSTLGVLAFRRGRDDEPHRRVLWLLFWFGSALAPVTHLLAPAPAIFAERFFYTPSAIALVTIACVASRGSVAGSRRVGRAGPAVIGLWLAWQAVATARHAEAWATEEGITRATARAQPRSARAQLWRARERAKAGDLATALEHASAATEVVPGWAVAWAHRGAALDQLGRPADAATSFQRAMSLDAGDAETAALTVQFFMHRGRMDFAGQAYAMHAAARGGRPDARVPRPPMVATPAR